jgi:hypothetical protein
VSTEWDDDDKTPVDPNPPISGPPKLRETPELKELRARGSRELELAYRIQQLDELVSQLRADNRRLLAEITRMKAGNKE